MGLVLGRAIGESIIIGGVIKVTVEEIRGGEVRLNTTAPKSITVHREEFQRQLEREELAKGDQAGDAR